MQSILGSFHVEGIHKVVTLITSKASRRPDPGVWQHGLDGLDDEMLKERIYLLTCVMKLLCEKISCCSMLSYNASMSGLYIFHPVAVANIAF